MTFPERLATIDCAPARALSDTLPLIRRTARHVDPSLRSVLPLAPADRRGPTLNLKVSPALAERALLFADALLRAAEALGWRFLLAPAGAPLCGELQVEGERLPLAIDERFKEVPRVPSAAERSRERRDSRFVAPRTQWIPTGVLRLIRADAPHVKPRRRSWYDRYSVGLEKQIRPVLEGLFEDAQVINWAQHNELKRRAAQIPNVGGMRTSSALKEDAVTAKP